MFDPTLSGIMAQVEVGKIVLPAMQRPFVWKDDRISKLVDSLLSGYLKQHWGDVEIQHIPVAPDCGR